VGIVSLARESLGRGEQTGQHIARFRNKCGLSVGGVLPFRVRRTREETMQEERRRNRSNDLAIALGLQLHHSATRAKFKSLVLSEELGLLVAAAGEKREYEELAALAPLLVGNRRYWQGTVQTEAGNEQVTVARVETPFGTFFLSGIAGMASAILTEMLQSSEGVARIVS